jgi:hypothetical protein
MLGLRLAILMQLSERLVLSLARLEGLYRFLLEFAKICGEDFQVVLELLSRII